MVRVETPDVKDLYERCFLCPRGCGVNRSAGVKGRCGETSVMRAALASLHFGEEPPVTGSGGSGTIFFSGCTLGCSFCQNYQISRMGYGDSLSPEEFAVVCLDLQDAGAENVNLVTGTHFAPGIVAGLVLARERGLVIPALWNTSGYDVPETIDLLSSQVSVWLPDLKTLDPTLAERFFLASDYPDAARAAILRMVDLSPPEFAENGTMRKGTIVRHLVLPGMIEQTKAVLEFFAEHLAGRAMISLMTQYTPIPGIERAPDQAETLVAARERSDAPHRFVQQDEYDQVLEMLEDYGFEDGFYQELVPGDDWLPDFRKENPFSSTLARTVWRPTRILKP